MRYLRAARCSASDPGLRWVALRGDSCSCCAACTKRTEQQGNVDVTAQEKLERHYKIVTELLLGAKLNFLNSTVPYNSSVNCGTEGPMISDQQ